MENITSKLCPTKQTRPTLQKLPPHKNKRPKKKQKTIQKQKKNAKKGRKLKKKQSDIITILVISKQHVQTTNYAQKE